MPGLDMDWIAQHLGLPLPYLQRHAKGDADVYAEEGKHTLTCIHVCMHSNKHYSFTLFRHNTFTPLTLP